MERVADRIGQRNGAGRRWMVLAGCGVLWLGALLAPLPAATPATLPVATQKARTRAEIEKLIDEAGKTAPEWWDATPLNYPQTLDLTWGPTPGQPARNLGMYIWDVIDPNPAKWHEGLKLVQYTLTLNKGNAQAQQAATRSMARIYAEFLGDYPRGAFWARKAGGMEITLADCYIKMGCREMAVEVLKALGQDNTRNGQGIKLWGELGEIATALEWAEHMATDGDNPTAAYLAAGDAYRRKGDIAAATKYYEKVQAVKGKHNRDDPVNKKRATANLEAIKLFDSLDLKKIADGAYKSSSIGYVGPVEVTVTVKDHGIEKVEVTNHHEKQFYGSLTEIPPRIVAKQGVKGIDTTTGATVTSEAIINASAKALSQAQK